MVLHEIKKLSSMKASFPRYNLFGDHHHKAMEAQILVLSNYVKDEDIYDQGWPEHSERAAADADTWMRGYTPEATPSDDWEAKLKTGGI